MRFKVILLSFSLLISSQSWAALLCPNNFNSIEIGDDVARVEAACGKADAKNTSKQEAFKPQEWVYYIQSYPGMPGTLKTTIAFDANSKVINMSVNGAGLSQTQICGSTIQFGDTPESIQAACGKPAYINETSPSNTTKPTEITELKYNSTPPVTLVFENGKLTGKK